MPRYTQANRPIRVDTNLGEDVLLLQSFTGEEGLSRPFRFRLSLLSEESAISPDDVLRKPMLITVSLENGDERYFHGAVSRFSQFGQSDGLTFYEAEIVPWLWFLSLSMDCKIFQGKDVLEIVEEVFDSVGLTDYDIRCTRNYPKREYCVQYRESHLNFVSRLMEEEGIFYFFEHSDSKHVLVLADDNSALEPCPGKETALLRTEARHSEDVVTTLQSEYIAHAGTVTLQDYDYEQPSLNLMSSISGQEEQEVYDYHPRRYAKLEDGERYARLHVEALESGRHLVTGGGTCRAFATGYRFELQDHFVDDLNQAYALVLVTHEADAGNYRAWDDGNVDYRNRFVGIPHSVPYRPPLDHPKPRIIGTQTAIVVGPPDEEVWTDNLGRIMLLFYWDRVSPRDGSAGPWVRVAAPWAGKGYGNFTIPRIGNEVVVDFLENDPDKPLVVGSVYNGEQTPPFDGGEGGLQMGAKSRTSPGGNGNNEISLKDAKGKELITIHAQKDETISVGNDQSTTVENDQTITVNKGNRTVTVSEGTISETAKKAVTVTSTDDYVELTAKSFFASQVASGNANVQGNDQGSAQIWGKQGVTVWSDQSVNVTCDSGPVDIKGATEVKLTVGGSTVTVDTSKIELSAGGSTITVNASGVTIKGPKTSISGGPIQLN